MKVGVTGASGFIGKLLCQALVARGDEVVVLSRRSDLAVAGCTTIVGDLIEEPSRLGAFVDGLDVLYHCAGELSTPGKMYALHVSGTRNLLMATQRYLAQGGRPIQWVQLSSVGAYGPGEGKPGSYRQVDETAIPSPVGTYEVTKTIADELVVSMGQQQPNFTFTILRPSNVVGSTMTNQSFFQMATMVKRRLFFYLGKGNAIVTYVHVNDVVGALIACGTQANARGQLYVLSNDCSQRALVEAIADFYQVSRPGLRLPAAPLYWLTGFLPKGRMPLTPARLDALLKRTTYSAEKIQSELDFDFGTSIPHSIPELLGNPGRKSGK